MDRMNRYLHDTAGAVRRLPSRLTVYECIDHDETLARGERHRSIVRHHEEKLCRAVDLVIGITEELAAPLRQYNPNAVAVNGAVDLDFFGRARLDSTPVPADIARLPKPVIGYMGSLDPWKMDVELLRYIATTRPDLSIAMVGYVWYGFAPAQFAGCPNIHVLGPKNYDDFPGYLKGMEVCIIPFPLNDITRNGDALKLYEYLGVGKPVVSVPVPSARRLAQVVHIASGKEEFVEAIQRALDETAAQGATRNEAIQSHTWAHRAREKMNHLRVTLARKLAQAANVSRVQATTTAGDA